MWDHYYNTVQQQTKNLFETSRKIHWNKVYHFYALPIFRFAAKTTCIWKFIQRQSSHLEFRWRYRRILFGYQARIFHFSMFHINVSGLWPEILLHIYILETSRKQRHIWTSERIFCFVSCMGVNNTQNILTESKRRKFAFTLCSPPHFKTFLLT